VAVLAVAVYLGGLWECFMAAYTKTSNKQRAACLAVPGGFAVVSLDYLVQLYQTLGIGAVAGWNHWKDR